MNAHPPRRPRPRIGITTNLERSGSRLKAAVGRAYALCVERAGGLPLLIPPLESRRGIPALLGVVDGLVFSGGEDLPPALYGERRRFPIHPSHPDRDAFETALLAAALRRRLPVLAVCYGMQLLNVVRGGTLYQDLPSQYPGSLAHQPPPGPDPIGAVRHGITIRPGTRLADVLGRSEIRVVSGHHQAVKEIGRGLAVSAGSPDGVVEAIEAPRLPFVIGVQWHPELEPEAEGTRKLFHALVFAADRRA